MTSQDLEQELLALLVLQEELEEERDLREGVELLQPHAPALSKRRGLPELQGGESHRDDLCHTTFCLELGKEAHLRHIKGSHLLME